MVKQEVISGLGQGSKDTFMHVNSHIKYPMKTVCDLNKVWPRIQTYTCSEISLESKKPINLYSGKNDRVS